MRGGCFSGSAIEHDGKLYLMFTGATNEGKGNEQTQCIAYSEDGIHFEKYAGNPVLTAPEGVPTDCFRDPKVWKHEDTYYMVCGASRDNKGQALLYRSKDMIHWTYLMYWLRAAENGDICGMSGLLPMGINMCCSSRPWVPENIPRYIWWVILIT